MLSNFYPPFVFFKFFIISTLILTTSRSRVCLMYTRNFLFSLRNCRKSTSKNLGYGLMHRPLSRQVWSTLKNLNLLAPRRGQRGRNHLRRLNDRPINAIIRGERQQNFQEKGRGASQSNLLNIPVDIIAGKTTSHGRMSLVVECARTCVRPCSLKYFKTYTGFHQLWMQGQHKRLKLFLLCVTYKSPDCDVVCFEDFRDRYMQTLVYGLPTLVVGDLNCHLLVSPSK